MNQEVKLIYTHILRDGWKPGNLTCYINNITFCYCCVILTGKTGLKYIYHLNKAGDK